MNNKGQALIEFVLILPIFLMILFVIVDFGMIFSTKIRVESDSDDVIAMIDEGMSIRDINQLYDDVKIQVYDYNEEFLQVEMTSEVSIITPGLDRILGRVYKVKVERIISNDKAW